MISEDITNIANCLVEKEIKGELTPSSLLQGLANIKEKAKDLKKIEESLIIKRDMSLYV